MVSSGLLHVVFSYMRSEGLDVEYTVEWFLMIVETWRGLELVKVLGRDTEFSLDSKMK